MNEVARCRLLPTPRWLQISPEDEKSQGIDPMGNWQSRLSQFQKVCLGFNSDEMWDCARSKKAVLQAALCDALCPPSKRVCCSLPLPLWLKFDPGFTSPLKHTNAAWLLKGFMWEPRQPRSKNQGTVSIFSGCYLFRKSVSPESQGTWLEISRL